MGYTPREVDEMSFWELKACSIGFTAANSGGAKAPTDEEFEAALALLPTD